MSRVLDRGLKKFVLLAAAPTAPAAPTVAEITAGVDVSPAFAAISGFTPQVGLIEEGSLDTLVDYQSAGVTSYGTNSIDFFDDDESSTIYDLFAPSGTAKYLLIGPFGVAATDVCEVWRVQVVGRDRLHDRFGQQQQYRVVFAVTPWTGQVNPVHGTIAA